MRGLILVLFAVSLLAVSCTQNDIARGWGGDMTVTLDPGRKLINASWKDADNSFWVLTRGRKVDEPIDTFTLQCRSSWGVFQGKVIIQER